MAQTFVLGGGGGGIRSSPRNGGGGGCLNTQVCVTSGHPIQIHRHPRSPPPNWDIAHGMGVVKGCGGMWLRNWGQKWGEKWEKNGTKYPFFTAPFSPFFRRSKISPTVPFVRISPPPSQRDKWGFLPPTDTHRHGGECGWLNPVEP